jgi:hypothetical protein
MKSRMKSSGNAIAGCGGLLLLALIYFGPLVLLYKVHGYTLDYGMSQISGQPSQVARWQKVASLPFVGSATVSLVPVLLWLYDTNIPDCPVTNGVVLDTEGVKCDIPPTLRLY